MPALPKYASSIAAGEGREVITIGTLAATSAHDRAARPPRLLECPDRTRRRVVTDDVVTRAQQMPREGRRP
jgi:hypothetical protein